VQKRPRVYQEIAGKRVEVGSKYRLAGGNRVGFELAGYDRNHRLLIDPLVLAYSTYLGGSGTDSGSGIAVDAAGSAYVTGYTNSPNFPTQSAYQTTLNNTWSVFVTKLAPDGSALVYSTYLGGSYGLYGSSDYGWGIAVDAAGSAYITGGTSSLDFPTTPGAFQTQQSNVSGGMSAFVTKLSPAGNSLAYSTYLGGNVLTIGQAIAVDTAGSAYVTGETTSANFPIVSGYQTTKKGSYNAFVAKVTPAGDWLVYSTFLGGSGQDYGYGIAIDTAGSAYVTGTTTSPDFPTTPLAYQITTPYSGAQVVFVTRLAPAGNALMYSTLLGNETGIYVNGIAVDGAGSAYVTGSGVVPTTQSAYSTSGTIFVTKFAPAGDALVYSTQLGGSSNDGGFDGGFAIAVDAAGSAYVAGRTNFSGFPTQSPSQTTCGAPSAFVTKFAPGGNALAWSTCLGSGSTTGTGIAVDAAGSAYVTGYTTSPIFPTEPLAFQANLAGSQNAFVTKLSVPSTSLGITKTHVGSFSRGQNGAIYTLTVSNSGPAATSGTVTVVETVPAGLTLASMAGAGWTCPGTAANNCTRSDPLEAGASYPAVTVEVNVAANAPGSVTNQAAVVGGGSGAASASDLTRVLTAQAVSVTPSTGTGSSNTFSFLYSDANGASDLGIVQVVVNSSLSGYQGCYVSIDPVHKTLLLLNDGATAWQGPITLPTSSTLQNSQCTVNGGSSSIALSGNNATVNLALSFSGSFGGAKTVYGYAQAAGGLNSGWTALGNWTVTAALPQAVSVTPSTGTGSSNTFSFVYSDANGASDLGVLQVVVNSSLSGYQGCYISIDPVHNTLWLLNDGATAWQGPITLPTASTLANSQCTINGGSSSIALSGNNATVNLGLSFSSGFGGAKTVYGYAQAGDGLNSGWTALGTWTVPTVLPQAVSVTPSTGTGSSNTFSFLYSGANGGIAQVVVNSSLSGYQACYISIDPVHKTLLLLNDAATVWQGPITLPTSGTLANSQCTINGGSSSIALSGNNATVNLALSFSSTFGGVKNVYGYAQAAGGLNSGWTALGNWTVPAVPPQAVSVTPSTGTGSSNTFSFLYSDANGASDLGILQVVVNSSLSGYQGCYISIDPVHQTLLLLNDGATAWQGPITLPTSGTLANSQCTINGGSSSIALSGNSATVNLALSFSGSFGGAKSVYGYAQAAGGLNSGWTALGNWTVP
jgi:uncharacterized repeat protein (TIGR01451 family)